jgi:site-specific DNA recombinase
MTVYLELGCVRQLSGSWIGAELYRKCGSRRKASSPAGASFRAERFMNCWPTPIYVGEIRHKQERHAGQHEAILPREL